MASHFLKPLTPLGAIEPTTDIIGGVGIREITDMALASVAQRAGKAKPFATAAKRALKQALPSPGLSSTKGDLTAFWTGPEQWFVEAPLTSHEDIAAILKDDFKDSASITEQSGGWCRFDVEGNTVVPMLERLCAVDTATMQKNAATRSVIEHIGVFILCRQAGEKFSVYGPRSSAGSLHHALITAAKSIS